MPRPFILRTIPSDPPARLVEHALNWWALIDAHQFVYELAIARAMYRKHRALVESSEWEQFWVDAYMDEEGYHPSEEDASDVPNLETLRKALLPQAEKTARGWMTNGMAERIEREVADAAFLADVG